MPPALRRFVPDFAFYHLQRAEMAFDNLPGTATGLIVRRYHESGTSEPPA